MRRFFYNQPNGLQVGKTLPVTEDIFHHWCKVLRANIGEQAVFFDGLAGEYMVTLTEVTKKQALVTVDSYQATNRELPFKVHIGLVMSRGERMDYAIQKATELGVRSIQLLTSQHGEVRLKTDQIEKKLAHWQQVAISACEQCGLNIVPHIRPPMALSQWLEHQDIVEIADSLAKLILAVPPQDRLPTQHANNDNAAVQPDIHPMTHILNQFTQPATAQFWLLIGAEGGFSDQEIADAVAHGFIPWQIGDRVLRTETAPVVALSSLLTIYQLSIRLQDHHASK